MATPEDGNKGRQHMFKNKGKDVDVSGQNRNNILVFFTPNVNVLKM